MGKYPQYTIWISGVTLSQRPQKLANHAEQKIAKLPLERLLGDLYTCYLRSTNGSNQKITSSVWDPKLGSSRRNPAPLIIRGLLYTFNIFLLAVCEQSITFPNINADLLEWNYSRSKEMSPYSQNLKSTWSGVHISIGPFPAMMKSVWSL